MKDIKIIYTITDVKEIMNRAWCLAEVDRIVRREMLYHGMAKRITDAIFSRSLVFERLAGKYEITGADRAAGPDETAPLVYSPKTYREWVALEVWIGEDE